MYKKILDIIRNKGHLSDIDTIERSKYLVEYIEIWERYFSRTIDGSVAEYIGHTEERLKPFYEAVNSEFIYLRNQLSKRK
jgi:hypothetical protein